VQPRKGFFAAENATPTPRGAAPDPALSAVRLRAVGKQRQPPGAKLIFYLGVKGRYARNPHPFVFDDEAVKIRVRLPVAPLTLHWQLADHAKTISWHFLPDESRTTTW